MDGRLKPCVSCMTIVQCCSSQIDGRSQTPSVVKQRVNLLVRRLPNFNYWTPNLGFVDGSWHILEVKVKK